MSSPFVVRRLVEEDWSDLRAVRLAMLLDVPLVYGSTYERERGLGERDWRDRAGGPVWMVYDGTLPVGTATLWVAPDQREGEGQLVGMWVAAHARGSGAADLLVGALLAEARRSGMDRVVLEVAEGNRRARSLYSRLGFVPTGRTRVSPAHQHVTEIEMEHPLGG